MSEDIVLRLRRWVDREIDESDPAGAITAAAAEIERLRNAVRCLADQDATLSVCNGDVTVTMDATLTDEEREAIKEAAEVFGSRVCEWGKDDDIATQATLRSLLERTK